MISLKKLQGKGAETGPQQPFRDRFHAWWHGYELRPITPVSSESPTEDEAGAKPSNAVVEEVQTRPEEPVTPWPEGRRKLAQLVWGPGFTAPGGAALATELIQPLGLDSSSSMLEIGAGMGGSSRTIAADSGAYVTGWDLDAELADEGTVQAEVHSLDKKASVHCLDPENYAFKPNFYNGALVHEVLHRFEAKEDLIKAVVDAMKIGGQIVIFELFFEKTASGSALEEWISSEGNPVYPWGIDAARQFLADQLIDIRVTSDDSERYCTSALKSWADFVEHISETPVGDDLVIHLSREADRWSKRVAAMKSGDLRMYRISGIKQKPVS